MMRWLRNLPLATKLRVIIVYAAAVALLTASALYISGEVLSLRGSLAEHLLTLATTVGENTGGALMFGDRPLARKVIASLRADHNVTRATLYDAKGQLFVDVTFGGNAGAPRATPPAPAVDDATGNASVIDIAGLTAVDIRVPVILDGERIGTMHLQAQLRQLYTELRRSAAFVLIGLLLAGAVAYRLSKPLQLVISEPVSELLEVARSVRANKDFSVRGVKHADDEIGALIDGFNGMLAELEQRDRDLRGYQNELEMRVSERTASLDIAVAESQEALERAEAASRAKSQFLATMSHEIRTPLNGVLGMNELLLASDLQSRQREWAAAVQTSGQHLLGVINDILDFSRIESGHMELESVDFSLADLIEDTLAMFAQPAAKKGLELAAQFIPNDAALPGLRGDPFRLRQVLANLLGNAIKFTERGEVVVRVALEEQTNAEAQVSICIADTGIGIAADAQDRIFESFSQADGSTTRRFGGTGLGLAICRRLVALMGGSIRVESAVGQGSRFWINMRLPKARLMRRERFETDALRGARALVVDDNQTNREILRQQLEGWHMRVACAASGDDALRQMTEAVAARVPFDLAILDMHMPGMDGLQLAGAIQERPDLAQTPLMMLTSTIASANQQRWQAAGVRRCVSKPIRRADLFGVICGILTSTPSEPDGPVQPADVTTRLHGRVLLVEDNPINQEVAAAMLATLGLQLSLAENGRDAVDLVLKRDFDLVLMDCQMPVMDGYEATAAIRRLATGRGERLPIIALTANAMQGDEQKCLDAGMNGFLAKPFTLAQLQTIVTRWLPADNGRQAGSAATAPAEPDADARASPAEAINMRALDALRAIDVTGSKGLVQRVLRIFLETAGESLQRVERAILDGNGALLSQAAHALKSSAANVGAESLSSVYRRLERLGRDGRVDEARALLTQLRREHERAAARMREILQEAA